MRLCAFIPARAGSKGIPGKNLKPFLGKPLVQWAVEAAVQAESVDSVVVSTDSSEIAALVEGIGCSKARVHHRSASSARDEASTEEVMLEFARDNQDFDHILLIQATTPILTGELIDSAVAQYRRSRADSLVSVVPMARFFWADGPDGGQPLNYDPAHRPRRQEAFGSYHCENGALYLTRRELLLSQGHRCPGRITLFPMDARYSWELDEPEDWAVTEALQRPVAAKLRSSRLAQVKLLALDLDGVLTDGRMIYVAGAPGLSKSFFTRDAVGISKARAAGIKVAIVTTDDSEVNQQRAERIQVDAFIFEERDKLKAVEQTARQFGIGLAECAYIGDDDVDLAVMRQVGVSLAPADAADSALQVADLVLTKPGGAGCVREACELLLAARSASGSGPEPGP